MSWTEPNDANVWSERWFSAPAKQFSLPHERVFQKYMEVDRKSVIDWTNTSLGVTHRVM